VDVRVPRYRNGATDCLPFGLSLFSIFGLFYLTMLAAVHFHWGVASASVRDGISAAAVVFAPDYGSEDDHQIRSHIFSRDCAGSTSPESLASAA
jgi:hypothetical protein